MPKSKKDKKSISVAVLMGSDSDFPHMKDAVEALKQFGVASQVQVLSAHRTPEDVANFGRRARDNGFRVLIAGAGGAAHLPGMLASYTELPVIGVPVPLGPMQGEDALLSIVQMPKGIPGATVAIGNAWNAGILAAQILAVADDRLMDEVLNYKKEMARIVRSKKLPKVS